MLVSRFAQLSSLLLLLLLLREVRYFASAVVGSSRRKPKHEKTRLFYVHSRSMSPREILAVFSGS